MTVQQLITNQEQAYKIIRTCQASMMGLDHEDPMYEELEQTYLRAKSLVDDIDHFLLGELALAKEDSANVVQIAMQRGDDFYGMA